MSSAELAQECARLSKSLQYTQALLLATQTQERLRPEQRFTSIKGRDTLSFNERYRRYAVADAKLLFWEWDQDAPQGEVLVNLFQEAYMAAHLLALHPGANDETKVIWNQRAEYWLNIAKGYSETHYGNK